MSDGNKSDEDAGPARHSLMPSYAAPDSSIPHSESSFESSLFRSYHYG